MNEPAQELTARPWGVMSRHFDLFEADPAQPLAKLETFAMHEKATLTTEAGKYRLYREEKFSGRFVLEQGGKTEIHAIKPSVFSERFEIRFRNRSLQFRPSWTRLRYTLFAGERAIGVVQRRRWFSREASIEIPEPFPLEAKAFLFWLALICWRRRRRQS